MAVFAVMHVFAFSYKEYVVPKDLRTHDSYQGGFLGWKAIMKAFNPYEFVKAFARGMKWLFIGRKHRHEDKAAIALEPTRASIGPYTTQNHGEITTIEADGDQYGADWKQRATSSPKRYHPLGDEEEGHSPQFVTPDSSPPDQTPRHQFATAHTAPQAYTEGEHPPQQPPRPPRYGQDTESRDEQPQWPLPSSNAPSSSPFNTDTAYHGAGADSSSRAPGSSHQPYHPSGSQLQGGSFRQTQDQHLPPRPPRPQ
jgi:hypothetical protein